MPNYEFRSHFIINTLFVGLIFGIAFFVLRILVPCTMPFLVGLGIAFLLKPVTALITRNTAFRRRAASLLVIALFYLVITSLVLTLVIVLFGQLGHLVQKLPQLYAEGLEPVLAGFNTWAYDLLYGLDAAAAERLELFFSFVLQSIRGTIQDLSAGAIGWITERLKGLPMFLTTLLFTVISSILISADYHAVTGFLLRQLPKKYQQMLLDAKDFMVGSLFKMLKAYVIILAITMIELIVGLWLLGVDLFLAIAVIIALLDILPLIGTGGVLIPWGVIELFRHNYLLGGGLLALFGVITLVRNIIEPKIVGAQIGLHPVITIAAMYLGLRLFGFLGLFLAPLSAILLKYLNDNGKIQIYK